MNDLERLKQAMEAEPMAVLVFKDWKSCAVCGFKDYPKYREGPVCFLTYRDIKRYCDADLKPRDCPFNKAIGIITPDGHVKYFREEEEMTTKDKANIIELMNYYTTLSTRAHNASRKKGLAQSMACYSSGRADALYEVCDDLRKLIEAGEVEA